MNVEVTKLPESRVALKIEVTAEEAGQALDRTYKQLVQRVNVPGFRKGKAPRSVVERVVGAELFVHEATDEAVRWAYRKAIDQENLTPIDEAEIQPGPDGHDHLAPDQSFHFEATVSVKPEVRLPDYSAIKVERSQPEVTDADVEALVQEIQQRNATLEPKTRAADIGNVVTMSISGQVNGKEVINQDDVDFELKDEDDQPDPMLPGLSRQLVGVNPGDIKEIALALPELYQDQEIAGQTLLLRILVKEIKRKVLPDIGDELVQAVSQFQTLDELRDALRANLQLEQKLEADQRMVAAAVEAVTSRTFIEIPPILIEEELERMIGEMQEEFERRHLSWQQYLETASQSEADIRNDMRESAAQNVKTSLVLAAVADEENIETPNREVDAALEDLFRGAQTSETERRRLRSSAGVRTNIRNRIRRQRAIQRLVEIMSGEDVSAEAAEEVADQTAAAADDVQETVAVEVGG